MAHDFNNVLTGIHGHAELMLATLPPGSLERESAKISCGGASERATSCGASCRSRGVRCPFTGRRIPTSSCGRRSRLLRPGTPSNVELVFEEVPGIGRVEVDPGAIHQVLMNLVTNAAHAIGERAGRVEISLERLSIDEGSGPGLVSGSYVRISIRDDGSGMEGRGRVTGVRAVFHDEGPGARARGSVSRWFTASCSPMAERSRSTRCSGKVPSSGCSCR